MSKTYNIQPFTEFDKDACRALSKIIEDAVRVAVEPFGVKVEGVGGTFDAGEYKARVTMTIEAGRSKQAATEWARWAGIYHLPVDGVGKTVRFGTQTLTIEGINSRSRSEKKAILLRDPATGKTYTTSPENARVALGLPRYVSNLREVSLEEALKGGAQ